MEERRRGESEDSLAALPSGGPALNLRPSRGRQRDVTDPSVGGAGGPFVGRVKLCMITRCCEERVGGGGTRAGPLMKHEGGRRGSDESGFSLHSFSSTHAHTWLSISRPWPLRPAAASQPSAGPLTSSCGIRSAQQLPN